MSYYNLTKENFKFFSDNLKMNEIVEKPVEEDVKEVVDENLTGGDKKMKYNVIDFDWDDIVLTDEDDIFLSSVSKELQENNKPKIKEPPKEEVYDELLNETEDENENNITHKLTGELHEIDDEPIENIEGYPSYISSAEIDDEECIYCGNCEIACPRDAITVQRKLPDRSKLVTGEIEVIEEECIHCGICEEMCPADAIDVTKTIGKESIEIDTDKCVYCLVCKRSCPVNAIKALCRLCSYGEYDLDENDAKVTGSTIIDQSICIKCGWCAGVCPTNAAKVEKAFVGKLVTYPDKCGTCGACIDVCPCNALSFPKVDAPGVRSVQIVSNDDYCIKCGACARICPNDAIEVTRTSIKYTPTSSESWTDALEALKD